MENNNNKIKFSEKIIYSFKRKFLGNTLQIFLIVAILITVYYLLYSFLNKTDLPEYDLTTNKRHTISDSSKEVLSKVDKEVEILVYGYSEDESIFEILRQYNKANEKITFRVINEENDMEFLKKHNLSEGYKVVIIICNDVEKTIDYSEFSTRDYVLNQIIDITEQVLTNSILAVVEDNKPKIYFTEGHQEYTSEEIYTIEYFLKNETFELDRVNIDITKSIPDDCDILAILAPQKDFSVEEAEIIKQYIAKGKNIFVAIPVLAETTKIPNLQSVLDEYGVQVENGFVLDYADDNNTYPIVFSPKVSSENKITSSIYSDGGIILVESARIKFKSDEELENMKIVKDILLYSSDESGFINDSVTTSLSNEEINAEVGKCDISASIEKTISGNDENDKITSKCVVVASSSFMVDKFSEYVSTTYPLSYCGSNKDFVINAMSYLGDKNNYVTIRKDYAVNVYNPTENQNRIVLTIIFSIPLFLLCVGFVIWKYRKERK